MATLVSSRVTTILYPESSGADMRIFIGYCILGCQRPTAQLGTGLGHHALLHAYSFESPPGLISRKPPNNNNPLFHVVSSHSPEFFSARF